MHDPTPILCRACGGPLENTADIHLECPHCGTRDELPRDAHARVRELRRRLAERARGMAQLSGLALGLANAFENPRPLVALASPGVAIVALLLAHGFATTLEGLGALPYMTPTEALGSLLPLLIPISLVVATTTAFLRGRSYYRRELRWRLVALPARRVGTTAACRCCAAPLPAGPGPLLRCRHCRTYSLVTADQQAEAVVGLAAEARDHEHRRVEVADHANALGRQLDRITYGTFSVIMGGLFLLPWLLGLLNILVSSCAR